MSKVIAAAKRKKRKRRVRRKPRLPRKLNQKTRLKAVKKKRSRMNFSRSSCSILQMEDSLSYTHCGLMNREHCKKIGNMKFGIAAMTTGSLPA